MTSSACALVGWLAIVAASDAGPDPNDPVYAELLKVRSGLIEAYNRKDLEGVLSFCDPRIIVTWQNGEVTEGREGVRQYYEKMMVGPNKIVESMTANPTVDNLAVLYDGDTAISRGAMNDHYQLTDGTEFEMHSRWSATLVKNGDRWFIAGFHASAPAFDNPLLRMIVRKSMYLAGGIAAAVGIVVGFVLARLFRKRRVRSASI